MKTTELALLVDLADHRIGELLPALALMRRGLRLLDGQNAVQQQDALPGPMLQEAMPRRLDAEVGSPSPCRCSPATAEYARPGER